MKAIILAGGYAKRLWPLTKNTPKQLLPIAGIPIIDYIIKKLEPIKDINEIIISTNSFFKPNFMHWYKKSGYKKKISFIIEKTLSENQKLGSIGALNYIIQKRRIKDDIFIIGGDNLFEFSLKKFISYHKKKHASVIAIYDIKDKAKVKGRYGIVALNTKKQVIGFKEKPKKPKTALVNTACAILSKSDVKLIHTYVKEKQNLDALGYFISWLINHSQFYAYVFISPWFDIGSFEAYEQAKIYYRKKAGL